ncbi:MAG: hypothetical protein ACI8RP_000677 [Urechidicola sp.]|jgi:hypothetical protein
MKRFIPTQRNLLIIIACLSLLSLWSFRIKDVTTELQGDVFHLNNGLTDVEVSILNEAKKPIGYFEPTDEHGHYNLTFNAIEGAAVYLKFEREGYSTLITEYFPLSEKEVINFNDVHLLSLFKPSYKKQFTRLVKDVRIKIQDTPQSKSYEALQVGEIAYFTFINRLANDVNNKELGYWYEVALIKSNGEKLKGYYFESH